MKKRLNEPHAQRRGRLKNGNTPGDFLSAPRCMANTRINSKCQQPAMKNGRCRLHGGKSSGPKTTEGKLKSQFANWKHGFYSQEEKNIYRELKARSKHYKDVIT